MKNKKKINVEKIINFFNLEIINKNKESIEYNDIYQPAIKRVGLDLAEKVNSDRISNNVIAWGTTESLWFQGIGKFRACEALEHIFKQKPPLVMLSKGVTKPALEWIVEVADTYNVPVTLSQTSSSYISTNVGSYLNNFFSEEKQIHGCLVLIGGTGVLIIGASGVGKSEAALELVQKGHVLISDDSVLIKDTGNLFIGRSPEITRNFLEVRGIGIIDIKYTYGIRSVAPSSIINLVVELVRTDKQQEFDRLGVDFLKYSIFGRSIKKIQIPIKEGGSTASLIEAAVSSYLSRHDGVNVLDEIEKRRLKSND
ncbi:HPr(Ser) kinase/phosphatase [Mycoplasma sp. CSL7503-lung]|uniref:HPr(Ser) kinase/phosphatase n=1 Tax=Mycoplasma sp. CSL7503-lung TaxID=536372 RepID=UPI0021CF1403|nr:HPr(Ser) kinase/phosphatase [Mycoplasma sp. CSL7503-lung]MCU4706883.1 HPr(Ser) kinase/phosphatase [Mycoplasma sp. CSL7503-lung]